MAPLPCVPGAQHQTRLPSGSCLGLPCWHLARILPGPPGPAAVTPTRAYLLLLVRTSSQALPAQPWL